MSSDDINIDYLKQNNNSKLLKLKSSSILPTTTTKAIILNSITSKSTSSSSLSLSNTDQQQQHNLNKSNFHHHHHHYHHHHNSLRFAKSQSTSASATKTLSLTPLPSVSYYTKSGKSYRASSTNSFLRKKQQQPQLNEIIDDRILIKSASYKNNLPLPLSVSPSLSKFEGDLDQVLSSLKELKKQQYQAEICGDKRSQPQQKRKTSPDTPVSSLRRATTHRTNSLSKIKLSSNTSLFLYSGGNSGIKTSNKTHRSLSIGEVASAASNDIAPALGKTKRNAKPKTLSLSRTTTTTFNDIYNIGNKLSLTNLPTSASVLASQEALRTCRTKTDPINSDNIVLPNKYYKLQQHLKSIDNANDGIDNIDIACRSVPIRSKSTSVTASSKSAEATTSFRSKYSSNSNRSSGLIVKNNSCNNVQQLLINASPSATTATSNSFSISSLRRNSLNSSSYKNISKNTVKVTETNLHRFHTINSTTSLRRSLSSNHTHPYPSLYHSTNNIYAKNQIDQINMNSSPTRHSSHSSQHNHHQQQPVGEGYHHIGARLSIHPIDRYDESITCCSLPPPSPAPTSDRFIITGMPAPVSTSSISSNSSLNGSLNHHSHHHHHHFAIGSQSTEQSTGQSNSVRNSDKYTTMHRAMSPSSRYRITSSERYHRDLSPKCTSSQQSQQQSASSSSHHHHGHNHHNLSTSGAACNGSSSVSAAHIGGQSSSDRYNVTTTTTHYLTNTTPLVTSDAYAYLSSTVHTPVKRYVPTPPPTTEMYSDMQQQQSSNDCTASSTVSGGSGNNQSSQHQQNVSTLPYRFRMKCCLTDPANAIHQQQTAAASCQSNRNSNIAVADHYATPPRVRPYKYISVPDNQQQQTTRQQTKQQLVTPIMNISSTTTSAASASSVTSATTCSNNTCNANSNTIVHGHGRQSRTGSITSQCLINDYLLQRTPSSEYLVGGCGGSNSFNSNTNSNSNNINNGARNASTPINDSLTNATCLHCNTMRRTTGVHQTTQTTGPISPVPQMTSSQLSSIQHSYASVNNHSDSNTHCGLSISPTPSVNLQQQQQLSPLSPNHPHQQHNVLQHQALNHQQITEQQQQQVICRSQQQQQQQQAANIIQSTLGRNIQHQQQNQSTISQLAVAIGTTQSQLSNHNLSNQIGRQQHQQHQQQPQNLQQKHLVASGSNNLQNQIMAGNIILGSANNLLSTTNTPQRSTLTIRQQMQQRFSRKQRLKEYIRKEISQFFGVDAHSEDEERHKWKERQKRLALRRLGPLKTDLEMSTGGTSNFGGEGRRELPPPGDRPDILPAQITTEETQISNYDSDLRLPIEKKPSVPTMFMSGIFYIIQALHKRQSRQPKQWSRSFAPAHVTVLNNESSSSDICEGFSISQNDEVFFDSPANDINAVNNNVGANGSSANGANVSSNVAAAPRHSSSKMIEHSRQLYMGERVHGWRTSAIIDQHIQQQPGGCVINGRSSINGGLQQQRLGFRGIRISSQIIDGVLENSRRPNARKVKMFHPDELDDRQDHRPFFTYWINTVQILVLILSLLCYGIGPIGLGIEQKTGQVLVTSLSLQTVQHQEQRNFWIGPRNNDLVHLGAKFAACMRRDVKIMEVVAKTRRQERETACCIRNDDSGCVQSSQADCSVRGLWPTKSISTWKKWSPEFSGPGGRISGSVCGLDPKYCDAPASIAPYEWPDDITKWPICRKTNSFSQRFRYKGQTAEHMVCEVIGHPCCTGVFGECRITTREYCDFVNGYFHEEASLCSQISCLNNVCGMFPFLSVEVPDQFYRLFTSLCLHAGIIHLAITIAFQHVFLADLERLIGPIRTAIVYIGSGLAGNLTSAILVPYKPEVGPLASLAGVISSLVVLLLLAHWRQLKKPHLALLKLIVIGGTLFGMGTLPWQQNFAGLIAGLFCGVYLTIALVPFISITKYGRKAKINLIWTCVLFHLFIYSIMFVIFYVFPTELTSIDFGDIINGNGFNTHSTINHKNRFDIDNYGSNMNSPHNHNTHHHHADVIDDRGGDDRVMSAGTVNEIKTKLMNLNVLQTAYNAALISNNFDFNHHHHYHHNNNIDDKNYSNSNNNNRKNQNKIDSSYSNESNFIKIRNHDIIKPNNLNYEENINDVFNETEVIDTLYDKLITTEVAATTLVSPRAISMRTKTVKNIEDEMLKKINSKQIFAKFKKISNISNSYFNHNQNNITNIYINYTLVNGNNNNINSYKRNNNEINNDNKNYIILCKFKFYNKTVYDNENNIKFYKNNDYLWKKQISNIMLKNFSNTINDVYKRRENFPNTNKIINKINCKIENCIDKNNTNQMLSNWITSPPVLSSLNKHTALNINNIKLNYNDNGNGIKNSLKKLEQSEATRSISLLNRNKFEVLKNITNVTQSKSLRKYDRNADSSSNSSNNYTRATNEFYYTDETGSKINYKYMVSNAFKHQQAKAISNHSTAVTVTDSRPEERHFSSNPLVEEDHDIKEFDNSDDKINAIVSTAFSADVSSSYTFRKNHDDVAAEFNNDDEDDNNDNIKTTATTILVAKKSLTLTTESDAKPP